MILQHDIQEAISTVKKGRVRGKDQKQSILRDLQALRYLSRRLGDALAWRFFGMSQTEIWARSGNSPVPIAPKDRNQALLTAVLIHEAAQKAGFATPLLHDLTDALRVGDATLITGVEGAVTYRTVEVKTRLLNTTGQSGDEQKFELVFHAPESQDVDLTFVLPSNPPVRESRPIRSNASGRTRLARQLDRMVTSEIRASARPWEIAGGPGEQPMLYLGPHVPPTANWKILRRAIRVARTAGTSFTLTDRCIAYVVIYNEHGIRAVDREAAEATHGRDFAEAGFSTPDGRLAKSVIMVSIPEPLAKEARTHLPFYLFAIPWRAISEIIGERLEILTFIDLKQLASLLREAGYDVTHNTKEWSVETGGFVIAEDIGDSRGELLTSFAIIRPMLCEFAPVKDALTSLDYLFGNMLNPEIELRRADLTRGSDGQATSEGRTRK